MKPESSTQARTGVLQNHEIVQYADYKRTAHIHAHPHAIIIIILSIRVP